LDHHSSLPPLVVFPQVFWERIAGKTKPERGLKGTPLCKPLKPEKQGLAATNGLTTLEA
jgi:hypothetical protein